MLIISFFELVDNNGPSGQKGFDARSLLRSELGQPIKQKSLEIDAIQLIELLVNPKNKSAVLATLDVPKEVLQAFIRRQVTVAPEHHYVFAFEIQQNGFAIELELKVVDKGEVCILPRKIDLQLFERPLALREKLGLALNGFVKLALLEPKGQGKLFDF